MQLGLRLEWLGTRQLWWSDAVAIAANAPLDGVLGRAVRGVAALYDVSDYLVANLISVMQVISWQLSGDNNAAKPKPYLLPGIAEETPDDVVKGDSLSIEQMDAVLEQRLGWSKRQPQPNG